MAAAEATQVIQATQATQATEATQVIQAAQATEATQAIGATPGELATLDPGPHVAVEWILEAPIVPGTVVRSAVLFRIEDGWHTYGNARNDTGFPARFTPVFPAWLELVGEVWPAPTRHVSAGGILDHVYEHEAAVFLDLRVAPNAPIGEAELGLSVDWLVCREACVFEGDSLAVNWNVSSPLAVVSTASYGGRTAVHAARLPQPLGPESGVRLERISGPDGGEIARISVAGAEALTFIPALEGAALVSALEDGAVEGNRLDLRLEPDSGALAGILEVRRAGHLELFRVP